MVTVEAAYEAAQELQQTGGKPASLKLALWAASLSGQKSLQANGVQTRALAPLVNKHATLEDFDNALQVSGNRFYSGANLHTLQYIQELAESGLLAAFAGQPSDWYAWREGMLALFKGHGLSRKMLSFAALLMWPLASPLVPVDAHHIRRLGYRDTYYARCKSFGKRAYLAAELSCLHEWEAAGKPYTPGIYAWYKWSEWRQATGAEQPGDRCESHRLLSPRWY